MVLEGQNQTQHAASWDEIQLFIKFKSITKSGGQNSYPGFGIGH